MKVNPAIARAAAAGLVLAGALTGCDLTTKSEGVTDIVIAADLELSGAAAPIGTAYERALRLKVEQLNAADVLGGRQIRLEVRDNRSDTSVSQRNINDFSNNRDVTALITGSCDQCAPASARTINTRHLPTVSLAAASLVSNPVADRRYIFKLGPNASDTAAALTNELRSGGIRTVGLLFNDGPYGDDGSKFMKAELDKANISVAASKEIRRTDTDVDQPVRALATAKPDAIVVWTLAEQAGLAATTARSAGFTGRLFFDSSAAGDLFLPSATAAATDGTRMVFPQTMVIDDVIATTPAKAARKQWFRDYTARYGSYFGYASFAADAVQLIADAVVRVGSNDRERIRDVLETSSIDGLSGPIRITPDNHSGLTAQALTLLVARSGRWRLAG